MKYPGWVSLVSVMYLIYNRLLRFHLLLLKAFNFYGWTMLSKLCLVLERRLVFKRVIEGGIEQSDMSTLSLFAMCC